MVNTKNFIKNAAVDLFYQKGYFASSMSNIALESGIKKASIYYHYASKEDILFDILMTTMAELTAYLNACLKGQKSIEEKMRAAVRAHVKFHCDRQKEVWICDSELRGLTGNLTHAFIASRDVYENIFLKMITQGMEKYVFEPGNAKVVSYAVLTMCTAVAGWFRPNGHLSPGQIAGIYEELVVSKMLLSSMKHATVSSGGKANTNFNEIPEITR